MVEKFRGIQGQTEDSRFCLGCPSMSVNLAMLQPVGAQVCWNPNRSGAVTTVLLLGTGSGDS